MQKYIRVNFEKKIFNILKIEDFVGLKAKIRFSQNLKFIF